MKVIVICPLCDSKCKPILEKTMNVCKDILFQCPECKCQIPISIYKTKYSGLWYYDSRKER